MNSRESLAEYTMRMHRVLEFIDEHLDQTMSVTDLAEVAHFSSFHFHRLFKAWKGETIGEYLRRRRLEVAAMRMAAQPQLSILEAALSVGFNSPEAFSRAFKIRFGQSPTVWRVEQLEKRAADSNMSQILRKPDQGGTPEIFYTESIETKTLMENQMNVKLVERKEVRVAYLRYTGPYGEGISRFWQQEVYPWMVTNDMLGKPRYGVSHDDPGITAAEQCRYDACVEVQDDVVITAPALITTIPGGRYAMLAFKDKVEEIGDSWAALLRDWLPTSGLQLDARPSFEYYPIDASYDPETGVFECEIHIPVSPL